MSGCPVFFIQKEDFFQPLQGDEMSISWHPSNGSEMLYQAVATNSNSAPILVQCDDLTSAWADFEAYHKIVEAAGGLVFNDNGACLFIYRRGHWDLPKGKIERGEARDEAALREVKEECGFESVEIKRFLTTTYHTYMEKGTRILKPSHWYVMYSDELLEALSPQTEEDISELKWATPAETDELFRQTYPMIPELYRTAQSSQTFIR